MLNQLTLKIDLGEKNNIVLMSVSEIKEKLRAVRLQKKRNKKLEKARQAQQDQKEQELKLEEATQNAKHWSALLSEAKTLSQVLSFHGKNIPIISHRLSPPDLSRLVIDNDDLVETIDVLVEWDDYDMFVKWDTLALQLFETLNEKDAWELFRLHNTCKEKCKTGDDGDDNDDDDDDDDDGDDKDEDEDDEDDNDDDDDDDDGDDKDDEHENEEKDKKNEKDEKTKNIPLESEQQLKSRLFFLRMEEATSMSELLSIICKTRPQLHAVQWSKPLCTHVSKASTEEFKTLVLSLLTHHEDHISDTLKRFLVQEIKDRELSWDMICGNNRSRGY